jgi:hypothetical protein
METRVVEKKKEKLPPRAPRALNLHLSLLHNWCTLVEESKAVSIQTWHKSVRSAASIEKYSRNLRAASDVDITNVFIPAGEKYIAKDMTA